MDSRVAIFQAPNAAENITLDSVARLLSPRLKAFGFQISGVFCDPTGAIGAPDGSGPDGLYTVEDIQKLGGTFQDPLNWQILFYGAPSIDPCDCAQIMAVLDKMDAQGINPVVTLAEIIRESFTFDATDTSRNAAGVASYVAQLLTNNKAVSTSLSAALASAKILGGGEPSAW